MAVILAGDACRAADLAPPLQGAAWPDARVGFSHLIPQRHATSPQFRHREAWPLPEDVFVTRCLARILCSHRAGRAAGRAAGGVRILLPGGPRESWGRPAEKVLYIYCQGFQ